MPSPLVEAAVALDAGRIAEAETLLRRHLARRPDDVAALRMMAEVAIRLGRAADAGNLLRHCLQLAPGFLEARRDLALLLHRRNDPAQAMEEIDAVLSSVPRDPAARSLKAAILASVGEFTQAIVIYDELVAEFPDNPRAWMAYGHALKTAGRLAEGAHAYRRSIALDPGLGESYWSLANLKTLRFDSAEVSAMRAQLERVDLSDENRLHFHFALGKALEDAAAFEESFQHYARGNALRRARAPYSADRTASTVRQAMATFSSGFFRNRAGWGTPASDPIFIVGLPRAGSTLVEQILASHSAVEGTMELHDIVSMAQRITAGRPGSTGARVLDLVATLDAAQARALGELYLERTRIQRRTAAPRFIDKLPNNWLRVGLIHLVLPNASIIDVRRDAMSCCFSCFKQHFARGQDFTYELKDLGRYYQDYVRLMAHFDEVLPGRVHRVRYESLVGDTETEVRRVLAHCRLDFEEACLRHHENERAVRTPSSEQVRSPIFRDGLAQWRNYEPWLEPLRAALDEVR